MKCANNLTTEDTGKKKKLANLGDSDTVKTAYACLTAYL